MSTSEEEFEKLRPIFDKWSKFGLFINTIDIKGLENFVKKGPVIIIGNHIGTLKDALTIYTIIPRPFVFTSNKMLFDKNELNFLIRKHLKRHLKGFGIFLNAVLKPIKIPAINFATRTVRRVGAIPVDLYSSKRDAIMKCQETVKSGKALILLQGRGRVMKSNPNPYVSPVRKGAAIISYNLYTKEGISVPITPMALFGTHRPFFIPGKIKVRVGKPMYISEYMGGGFEETVERFRSAIERTINTLFFEILRS
ncbi:MAG: lysophospholipid acyltransferase family protein [Candidatus Aminicenantes bacterium]|jgi:1-acyl-sn-glycerol-3-phosphate acyltransferase